MKRNLKRAVAAAITLISLQATSFTANAVTEYTPCNDVLVVRNPILYKTSSDILGNYVFSVNLAQKDGKTYFYDMNRNIIVGSSMSNIESTDSTNYYHENNALLYNVGKAWDFYNGLGWDFYKSNEPIRISLSMSMRSGGVNNASASNYGLLFGIGDGIYTQNWGTDIDVVTHEYTHLVTQLKLGWDSTVKGETACLMEAYSDIMGELNDGTREWKIGTNQYIENINTNNKKCSIRDIKSPNDTITPNYSGGYCTNNFYTNYISLREALPTLMNSTSGDRTYSALGSTVISNAAYRMEFYGIPAENLKVIWYRSMDKLKDMTADTKEATFSDCRKAVLASTDVFTGTTKTNYDNIIKRAFDEVEVYIMGDVNDDGEIDSKDIAAYKSYINGTTTILNTTRKKKSADLNYDGLYNSADLALLEAKLYTSLDQKMAVNPSNASYFTGMKSVKFPSTKYWNNEYDYLNDTNATTETPCNHDNNRLTPPHCKYMTINNTFFNGYNNTFNISAEEPYYQCAGFAKKLQYEYFNTTKYLQLSNLTKYEPRVGDHLRVSYRGIANHSVFVTSVSGNTFTYADCNSNGSCNIKWGGIGNVDSSGSITLDGSIYSFSWVERPIMVGDVNGDSYVNSGDSTAILSIISNSYNTTNISTKYLTLSADINRDGTIDIRDVNTLNQYINGSSSVKLYYVR
ncbi:dockerin type I domain-containing protein [Pseudobacteroides cellulosolvens]|uniref:Peptidase M4 thermolysin n=1 Tax=Pseudobacteroides cellulosolvens ATCC 35603 = DSM 2933 TaxID=398512 RepID=A0A0L6JWX8_9FIRM|nr:dockerin type I domain-containing protein [Pseudobacteroides cellulosolvens]KNY30110.1 peptidase M4 thermolysin [Pseudobacteroides cellulosolvens ATCC 35603 = DSM 2933]